MLPGATHSGVRVVPEAGAATLPGMTSREHGPTRRALLRALGVAAVAASLGGCASDDDVTNGAPDPPVPPGDRDAPWVPIDVHCHVFNGADVPVRGFLRDVVLAAEGADETAADALAWLVDRIVQAGAPGYDAERAVLERMLASGAVGSPADTPGDTELRGAVATALEETPRLRDELETARRAGAFDGPEGPDLPEWLLRGTPRRYVAWAWLLTRHRYEICAALVRAYGGGDDGVQLFTPAMVDLDLWAGGDTAETSADEQVALMELVTRLFGGRVHPIVGFNPWKAALGLRDGRDPLDPAREAVARRGFVGVKLYPPMGFAPTSNNLLPPVEGLPPGLRRDVDLVLDALYGWCAAEAVPIMAHCEQSNEAGPGLASRADPRRWGAVLRRHPDLRLNLAHFGGHRGLTRQRPRRSWSRRIAELMERHPHVYADVGHFDEIVADKRLEAWVDGYERLLEDHPIVARRLMYGSDWHLLMRQAVAPAYLDRFRSAFGDRLGDDATADFLGRNAARFLGVRAGGANRARLAAFYDRHAMQKPNWWRVLA